MKEKVEYDFDKVLKNVEALYPRLEWAQKKYTNVVLLDFLFPFKYSSQISSLNTLCRRLLGKDLKSGEEKIIDAAGIKEQAGNGLSADKIEQIPLYTRLLKGLQEYESKIENGSGVSFSQLASIEQGIEKLESDTKDIELNSKESISLLKKLESDTKNIESYSKESDAQLKKLESDTEEIKLHNKKLANHLKWYNIASISIGIIVLLLLFFSPVNNSKLSSIKEGDKGNDIPPKEQPDNRNMDMKKYANTLFNKYDSPISVACTNIEKEYKKILNVLDEQTLSENRSRSILEENVGKMSKYSRNYVEEGCLDRNQYFFDKWFNYTFLVYHILDQQETCEELYEDYTKGTFSKRQETIQLMKAIMLYRREQPTISKRIDSLNFVLSNIDANQESYLTTLTKNETLASLSDTLEYLKKIQFQEIRKEEEEKKSRAKENLKIWVYDHKSTTKSKPKNIVSLLKEKGFLSVEEKTNFDSGEYTVPCGYYTPKMLGEPLYKEFWTEIRGAFEATNSYSQTYENVSTAESVFIRRLFDVEDKENLPDVVLVF